MIITKIEEQKKNKKRCSIFVDGEYYGSVDKDILQEVNFSEGMNIPDDEFNQKMEIIQYKSALKTALSMLVRSSRTENEIGKKLTEMDFPEAVIEKVLCYLKEIGYINDESYAESLIRYTKDTAGCSRRNLFYKLSQKGIDNEIILQKLDESGIDEYASALKAAEKKAASIKGSRREKRAKLYNFLFRKGFGMDVCSKVISELQLEDD
ncbi:MAG: regulatory protein RecX [Caulobacteraceae bacterium]